MTVAKPSRHQCISVIFSNFFATPADKFEFFVSKYDDGKVSVIKNMKKDLITKNAIFCAKFIYILTPIMKDIHGR